MQTTTNYGFNIVEGTDIVNPLTQLNPNFTALDTDLKAVSDNTIDSATCIKTGTVHAVTRVNTSANVFRFTATGNWNTGDTMTVDGTLVSVYLPDGSAPTDGCFVINTEVIAVIQGTRVTLYSNASPTPGANDIEYVTGVTVKDQLDFITPAIVHTEDVNNVYDATTYYTDLTVSKTGLYKLFINFRPIGANSALLVKYDPSGDPEGGIATVGQYAFASTVIPIQLTAGTPFRVYFIFDVGVTPTIRIKLYI